MKRTFFSFGFLCLFVAALSFIACNSEASSGAEDPAQTEQQHDHGDHDHAEPPAPADEVDKTGPEYTSAYICPMHCKGSGSDKPGKCPACGMDYVANNTDAAN
jgi:hypothetical protein